MLEHHNRFPATLFTGVPGIGKSVFLIYFLFRFLNDERFPDKRFALEFLEGTYHYFEPCSTGGFYCSQETVHSCPVLEIPIFSDIKGEIEPCGHGKWLFIFSSPNPKRFKETMKTGLSFEYTFPTWQELELKFIDDDDKKWYDKFVLFGGVPRYVFWNGVGENPFDKLDNAIDSKEGGIIADFYFKHGFGNIDSEVSYMILHINPPWSPADNDWHYAKPAVYSFGSDKIFRRIAEKHGERLLAEPITLFDAGVASEEYGGGSSGNLFEKICLWLKPIAGNTIEIRPISNSPNDSFSLHLPPMELLEYHWKENARNDPTKRLQVNICYQPKISNLESGNSFCVVPWGTGVDQQPVYALAVLQMTVGETHPVKVNGLHDILLAYPEEIQKRIVEKMLIFVTPLDGKLNSVQPLHTQDNKVADSIPQLVKGFKQYVCRIKL